MTDTLCVLPFVHFNLLPNGQASVCCASNEPLQNEQGETLNVRQHSLREIWQSKELRELRRQMLNGAPNGEATPVDLLLADHVSHFTRHDLARLLADGGWGAAALADDWVSKELSAVALPEDAAAGGCAPACRPRRRRPRC